MAKKVLKPIEGGNKILLNRKTRCRFSYSARALESDNIEFISNGTKEQMEMINNVKTLHHQIQEKQVALARARKYRDIRWMDEISIEIKELQEKLDNEIYPEIDREMVETAEDIRKREAGNTNIQVNLDAGQIANAINDAQAGGIEPEKKTAAQK